jgi:hypothetical protein
MINVIVKNELYFSESEGFISLFLEENTGLFTGVNEKLLRAVFYNYNQM